MVSLSLFRRHRLTAVLALTLTMSMAMNQSMPVSAFLPVSPPSTALRYRSARVVRGMPDQPQVAGVSSRGATRSSVKTCTRMVGPAAASVLAGSIAGAIGVGVAFPLDTLKTKAQVLSQQHMASASASASAASASASASGNSNANIQSQSLAPVTMFQTIAMVYKTEGWQGFFGGVKGMMAGQAVIKALAFSTNAATLAWLTAQQQTVTYTITVPPTVLLLTAACTAGLVTSFVVAPIERVKVMMQASSAYRNEWHCLSVILDTEGWPGLFSRGLGPTLAREIPSYGLYFWTYGFLTGGQSIVDLGALSPLVFGAVAGMAAWIPVYPIDVVKTLIQNTAGDQDQDNESAWQVMRQVYRQGGVGAFFDGLTPKLLRAAVNHATTFYLYDLIMQRFAL
jgi:hypothetical protein